MSATRQKSNKAARVEEQRQLQRKKDLARVRGQQSARRNRIALTGVGTLLAVLAMVAAVYYSLHGGSTIATTAVAADLGPPTSAIASPPADGFSKATGPLYKNGKPVLLFVGAQYCPHCAGQRWSVLKALSQFGTLTNLKSSSSSDGNIPTFDLTHAGYTSKYIAFDHKDVEDRNHNPLQSLDSFEQSAFSRLDPTGGIPLVLGGSYSIIGDAYNLADIQGKSFNTVQAALQHADASPIVTDVDAEANALTAFLCRADSMRPGSVCGRPTIRAIVKTLR